MLPAKIKYISLKIALTNMIKSFYLWYVWHNNHKDRKMFIKIIQIQNNHDQMNQIRNFCQQPVQFFYWDPWLKKRRGDWDENNCSRDLKFHFESEYVRLRNFSRNRNLTRNEWIWERFRWKIVEICLESHGLVRINTWNIHLT